MKKQIPDINSFKSFIHLFAVHLYSIGAWAMDNEEDKTAAILEVVKVAKQQISFRTDKADKKRNKHIELYKNIAIVVLNENTSWAFDSLQDCGRFKAACTRKFKKTFNIS